MLHARETAAALALHLAFRPRSFRQSNFVLFASSVVFSDVLKAPQYVRSLVDTPTELQVWNSHGLQGLCNVLFQILPLAEDQHLFACCCPLDLLNPCPMASPRLLMLLRSMTKICKRQKNEHEIHNHTANAVCPNNKPVVVLPAPGAMP